MGVHSTKEFLRPIRDLYEQLYSTVTRQQEGWGWDGKERKGKAKQRMFKSKSKHGSHLPPPSFAQDDGLLGEEIERRNTAP